MERTPPTGNLMPRVTKSRITSLPDTAPVVAALDAVDVFPWLSPCRGHPGRGRPDAGGEVIEQIMPDGFRRRIEFRGAFDKRHTDPSKDYGVHGMDLRFVLIGPKGATQFLCYTGLHLPHVREELFRKRRGEKYDLGAPMGADIGYHAREPQYEGQSVIQDDCPYVGGPCYYGGSGLAAEEFMPTFLAEGDDAVWTMLRERYDDVFGPTTTAQEEE
jgi:hypothetical protein